MRGQICAKNLFGTSVMVLSNPYLFKAREFSEHKVTNVDTCQTTHCLPLTLSSEQLANLI